MSTIVGVFRNGIDVERALFDLDTWGYDDVSVIDYEQELAALPGTGKWVGLDESKPDDSLLQQVVSTLQQLRVPQERSLVYADYVQWGMKLVAVQDDGQHVRDILDILCSANGITDPAVELMW